MEENLKGFEEKKKEIINSITGILIESLEKMMISQIEGREIATFILDNKDGLMTDQGITLFLAELANKWSIYKNYIETYNKTEQASYEDKQKLDQIKSQLIQLSKVTN